MGLTIHWCFQAECRTPEQARDLLERLRQRATQLPFGFVADELAECRGDSCRDCGPDDALHWMKVLGCRYHQRGEQYYSIPPEHLFAFLTSPGEGCEPAVFGLGRYPRTIEVEGKACPTGLRGWSWTGFCKTQYASNPAEGGVEHFLKCHLSLIQLLDTAKELGILEKVIDEGEYWEQRDRAALARKVERWNRLAARIAGQLKDAGANVQAPIAQYPNFEHLEAQEPFDNR